MLLLLLLLALLSPSSCKRLDPSALIPDAGKCYNISIPYPFGITGNYSLGLKPFNSSFGISCDGDGSAPMLTLPSGQYKVVNFSLSEGTITILGQTVAWRCNASTKFMSSRDIPPPDLLS